MARAIKKVKVKKKHGKKFWIILSSIIAAVLTAGVIIGVVVYNNTKDETYDYFSEYSDVKINYDNLSKIIEQSETEHIFIFAYDGSTFDAMTEDDDPNDTSEYSKIDTEIAKYVGQLYDAVQTRNETETVVSFYIINTALIGNSTFLNNDAYGKMTSAPCLVYVYGETYSQTTITRDASDGVNVSGVNVTNNAGNSSLVTLLKTAKNYVSTLVA